MHIELSIFRWLKQMIVWEHFQYETSVRQTKLEKASLGKKLSELPQNLLNYLRIYLTTLEFTELPLNLLNYLGFWKFKFECYKYFSPKLAASTHIATEEESFFNHPGGHVSVIHTFATIGIDKLSVFGWTFVWKPPKRMWRQFCNCNKRIDSIQGL